VLPSRRASALKANTAGRDFYTIFKTTPGKWLLEKRLLYAKSLLAGNNKKAISDVAFESGFETLAHFSRSFKHRFGVAPSVMNSIEDINSLIDKMLA